MELDVLLSLPSAIAGAVLSEWVDVETLKDLDSAYCHRKKRRKLLDLFRSAEFCSTGAWKGIMEWLLLREIKCRSVNLDCSPDDELVSQYLRVHGEHIRNLSIIPTVQEIFPSPKDSISAVGKYCSNLTWLMVMIREYHPGVAEILRNNPKLEDVKFTYSTCMKSDDRLDVVLPKLYNFQLYYHDENTVDLSVMYKMFPNVLRLCIPSCSQEVPEDFFQALAPHTPKLRTLIMYDFNPASAAPLLTYILQCRHIIHLDLRSTHISDAGLYELARTLKLQTLAVVYNHEITDDSLQCLAKYCCATLQVLLIDHSDEVNDAEEIGISPEAVHALKQKCTQLEFRWSTILRTRHPDSRVLCVSTSLCLATEVADSLLFEIAALCKSLRTLDLQQDENYTPVYTDFVLHNVIENCAQLVTVWVSEYLLNYRLADVAQVHPGLFQANGCDAPHDAIEFPI